MAYVELFASDLKNGWALLKFHLTISIPIGMQKAYIKLPQQATHRTFAESLDKHEPLEYRQSLVSQ